MSNPLLDLSDLPDLPDLTNAYHKKTNLKDLLNLGNNSKILLCSYLQEKQIRQICQK